MNLFTKATTKTLLPLLLLGAPLASCQSAYYATMEKFGVHKRDILVDRVVDGKDAQADAQEQFKTTFERFKELSGVEVGEIEDVYNRLNKEFERCESEAEEVRERIESIEGVASDLFSEWDSEIQEMSSPDLQRQSRESLEDTKVRYGELISVMKQAEQKMDPVLVKFRDQVLFLKHNLNARAISSLEQTVVSIEGDVSQLIQDMEASIAEAEDFISSMES